MNHMKVTEGVREFHMLKSTISGRTRLLPSRGSTPRERLSGSFAHPIHGRPQVTLMVILSLVLILQEPTHALAEDGVPAVNKEFTVVDCGTPIENFSG